MPGGLRILGDVARMAGGAAGALAGTREEVQRRARDRRARVMDRLDLVTREDFERVEELAARARAAQEALADRVADLELRLAALAKESAAKARPSRRSSARKPAAKASAAAESDPATSDGIGAPETPRRRRARSKN